MDTDQEIVREIMDIYKKHGHAEYGERCNMLSHSVQTGLVIREKGYDNELILAGFLHDIGHLTPLEFHKDQLKTMGDYGIEAHDQWGASYLRQNGFSSRVITPVANHVKSKRYLCLIDSEYYDQLSFASKKTLQYQGGVMNEKEAKTFEQEVYFKESIIIRKAEEQAKIKNFHVSSEDLDYFEALLYSEISLSNPTRS